eukprot:COSAG01_NODE_8165_length_2894_cov_49.605725_1_plen_572_part_00
MASTLSVLLSTTIIIPFSTAVHQGYLPASSAEVPHQTGFLFKLDENEQRPAYTDCLVGSDDTLTSTCSGGLISEGVFLTAAHCFENKAGRTLADITNEGLTSVSDGSADLSLLRVGLGAKFPYRNDDGTCTGSLRGTNDNVYKVKAVYVHKKFQQIGPNAFSYSNPKTGASSNTGTIELDHMDVAVVLLEECASDVSVGSIIKPRYGKVAGGMFSHLNQLWASYGSTTNTGGLPGSLWGYGESEDDAPTRDSNNKLVPKPVRRANWNFVRGTSPPSVSGGKTWGNCDWLPDDTALWQYGKDTTNDAYTLPSNSFTNIKASPFLACTPRNPNNPSIKSRCADQISSTTCTNSKANSGKSYCSWDGGACDVNDDTAGGIGMVTYPSTGGGDSGGAVWYVQNTNKLTLHDRDQLVDNLVHIGIAYAATKFFPGWDQTVRTDYFQNWIANVIDRDTCASKATKDYFEGFDSSNSTVGVASTNPPATQSGWHEDNDYAGMVKGQVGVKGLGALPKRGNAGTWNTGGNPGTTSSAQTTGVSAGQPTKSAGESGATSTSSISVTLAMSIAFVQFGLSC